MYLKGKGLFAWMLDECENGDAERITDKAKALNLSHILPKIANGTLRFNVQDGDLITPLHSACIRKGIDFVPWHYIYGLYPEAEAEIAAKMIEMYDLKIYVINAEVEFKSRWQSVDRFFVRLAELLAAKRLNHVKIGLSSYRYPLVHPEFPWRKFENYVDFYMPQVYWMKAHNPAGQLAQCLREYRSMTNKPIYPTGSAFKEHGWVASPQEVVDFSIAVAAAQLPAYNYWEWMNVDQLGQPMWDAIAFAWPPSGGYEPTPPEEPDTFPDLPEHLQPIGERTVAYSRGVNVRRVPTTRNNTPIGLLKNGKKVDVLHRAVDKDGNIWVYIGEWMAEKHNGQTLMK